jgi:undecaprenyl-diphosphatase
MEQLVMTDNTWISLILGLVEGITEFLPVSSTGHLIVIGDLLHFGGNFSKLFEVVIQLGSILAVVWLYRKKLLLTATSLTTSTASRHFTLNVLLAFAPAVFIGFAAHDFIKRVLFSPAVVGWALIVGGIAILVVERWRPKAYITSLEQMPLLSAFKIGFFQCLAMIPGTSRAGATIVGALLLGVTREVATEFSFFLAIPTMAGATALDLYKARHDLVGTDVGMLAFGFLVAFFSALLVVKGLIGFVSRHGFTPFAWYRIIAGAAVLALLYRA